MGFSANATVSMVAVMVLLMWSTENCVCGDHLQLRRKELSVYIHDKLNVTDFVVAQPAAGRPGAIAPTDSPFGTLFFVNDVVTEGPDPASATLGNYTASFIECSLDYGSSYMTSSLLTFTKHSSPSNPQLQGLHGTLAVSGITSVSDVQPQPVTGGTGSFAFALGSLTLVPIDVSSFTQVYRLDLNLYWPPYSL